LARKEHISAFFDFSGTRTWPSDHGLRKLCLRGYGQGRLWLIKKLKSATEPDLDDLAPVTLTLTRFAEPDALLEQALARLAAQTGVTGEILLIDQKPGGTVSAEAHSNASWTGRTIRQSLPGLSAARNLSLREAAHDHVLFCDADALAHDGWAMALSKALSQPGVAIAGCRILPAWSGAPPMLTRSRIVLDQYSLFDLGDDTKDATRVVGAGFGVDRSECSDEMQFDEGLGRRDGQLFSGEESDLCHRVTATGGRVVYVGRAVVDHVIQPERMRVGWILKRLYYAGLGRGHVGGAPNPSKKPGLADWLFLPVILPPYALGWLVSKWRGPNA
jgi:hypothetical protein